MSTRNQENKMELLVFGNPAVASLRDGDCDVGALGNLIEGKGPYKYLFQFYDETSQKPI
jgi:hypothetical protein